MTSDFRQSLLNMLSFCDDLQCQLVINQVSTHAQFWGPFFCFLGPLLISAPTLTALQRRPGCVADPVFSAGSPEPFLAALGPLFYTSFRIFMSSSQKILLEFRWGLHLLYNLISGDFSLQTWALPSVGRLTCCRLLCCFKKVWEFSLESCYFYCEQDF